MKKFIWGGLAVLFVLGGIFGYKYYNGHQEIKQTKEIKAQILRISEPETFSFENGKYQPDSVDIYFNTDVAVPYALRKLNLTGFKMSPETTGDWRFMQGNKLSFTPKENWLPEEEYKVSMPDDIFAEGIKLSNRSFTFKAPKFTARKKAADFYEDPRDIRKKSVTASFEFNYPILEDSIKKGVQIKTIGGKTYDYTYTLTDGGTVLHIVSAPVELGKADDFAYISVSGVKNLYNNADVYYADDSRGAKVLIPSASTFFKVKSIKSRLIRDEENNPEQIVAIDFSTKVDEESLNKFVEVSYCTKDNCDENTPEKYFTKLKIEALPTVEGVNTHFFKYQLAKRYATLRVTIKEGVRSAEGFPLPEVRQTIVSANYPQEVFIRFDGAVMPLKNHKQVNFASRGVSALKIKVAKIFDDDLNHLITQSGGSFSTPYFYSYDFNENNIATVFEKTLSLNVTDPTKLDYSALDLASYLEDKHGIFLISVAGYENDRVVTSFEKRLITVTDLGIIVKDNADNSHTLFVANISEGKPVDGAKVEVLGKNGLSISSAVTNAEGKANLPNFNHFTDGQQAIAYKISYQGDMSFLPINRSDRVLDYSRYNVGGEYVSPKQNDLKAYLFSDRGIYRPGETAHFGILTRLESLKNAVGIPLVAQIWTPDWKLISEKTFKTTATGMQDITYTFPATSGLGKYTLQLYKNNGSYKEYINELSFDVEEFLPDTMKLSLAFEPKGGEGWNNADVLSLQAHLTNLYGTAAEGHIVKGYYRMTPAKFAFDVYKDYNFNSLTTQSQKNKIVIEEEFEDEKTDKNGVVDFGINLKKHLSGTYRLTAVVTGLERSGGRGVEKVISALFSPESYIVGYKTDTENSRLAFLDKDSKHKIHLIAIDSGLKQISKGGLVLKIFNKEEIRTLTLAENGTYGYQHTVKNKLIKSEPLEITETGVDYVLDTSVSGDYLLVVEEDGGKAVMQLEYSVSGEANHNFSTDKLQHLKLTLDRQTYKNKEKIKVQIRSPFVGLGLMTIEQDKVYASKWFKADSKAVVQEIELPEGVNGNAYLNVAIMRDVTAPEIFDKPLSYAIAPFNISKKAFSLPITLSVPESVKPGEDFKIGYSTPVEADIFLWGVNTGILQVSDYKLPSPLDFFISKRALQVVTRQILDLVLPDSALALQVAAAGGGDDEAENELAKMLNPFARKQNTPAVFWSGRLKASPKMREFSYRVPETFNGEMKIMAVGMTPKQFGNEEKSVFVRGDFALTPTTPLYVAPEDEFDVGTSVSNLVQGSGKNYPVKITLQTTDGLQILGENSQVAAIDENGESSVSFRVKALNKLGAQTIHFVAEAEKDAGKRTVMTAEMAIRPAVPLMTDISAGKANHKAVLKDFALKLYPDMRSQKIYATPSPLILTKGMLAYLKKYPHWCTEQSISKIFPAMALFFNLPANDVDAYTDSKFIYDTYDDVMNKLIDRQRANGGFSMWGGGYSDTNDFISVYALEFLTAAKKYGFAVPEGMYARAITYAKELAARKPAYYDDTIPAYATYVLTEAGEVTTNYLLNLEGSLNQTYGDHWQHTLNGTYIAAAYQLLHNSKKAVPLIKEYKFSEDDTDNARYLYIANKLFADKVSINATKQVDYLLRPLEAQELTTTQSAFSILALTEFGKQSTGNVQIDGLNSVNNGVYTSASFDAETKEVTLSSDDAFFYTIEQEGFLTDVPNKPLSKGIQISKEFRLPAGKTTDTLELGDEITVMITLHNTKRETIYDVAVVDLLAGGLEIVRDSFESEEYLFNTEAREDRALMYFNLGLSPVTISYKARVTASGDFVVPPVFANAMYDPKILAHNAAERLVINQ